MLVSEIITKFQQYVDDTSELSSSEELALCQKVYNKVWNDRVWEFAKAAATGTTSTVVPYVTLPANFSHLIENNQSTDMAEGIGNNAAARVIFVGSGYLPFQVINWSDRRQYRDVDGYAYIDLPNRRLVFTKLPTTAESYEFDYHTQPDTLTTVSTPTFPSQFHDILYHGMAVDNDIILRFPKAESFAAENQAFFKSYLEDMAHWNSQFWNN
jgi:hypothetical protein